MAFHQAVVKNQLTLVNGLFNSWAIPEDSSPIDARPVGYDELFFHPFLFGHVSGHHDRPIHFTIFIKDGRSNFVEISLQFWIIDFRFCGLSGFACLHIGDSWRRVLSVMHRFLHNLPRSALGVVFSKSAAAFIHPPYPVIFILNNNDIGNGIQRLLAIPGCLFQLIFCQLPFPWYP